MEILLTLVLFAPLAWLLERTHRRTQALPRVPFGADAASEASTVYREQVAELRYLSTGPRPRVGRLDVRSAHPRRSEPTRSHPGCQLQPAGWLVRIRHHGEALLMLNCALVSSA